MKNKKNKTNAQYNELNKMITIFLKKKVSCHHQCAKNLYFSTGHSGQ
jgi:hypothetical protein